MLEDLYILVKILSETNSFFLISLNLANIDYENIGGSEFFPHLLQGNQAMALKCGEVELLEFL